MAKIQAVWAIDIGQAALKGLKLVPGELPGQVIAEAFDYVEFPKIRSQPDADSDELVREAMVTFLERNDLTGCKIAIGVSGQAGLVKFIKLPPVEKKRIPDIVKFEARQQIPFALEEVVWDYQAIGGDDKDKDDDDDGFSMAEVGLFAMKRDQIHQAIQPFKAAGIEVDVVQMAPIALYNFAAFDRLSPAVEIEPTESEDEEEEEEPEVEAEAEAEIDENDPKAKKAKAKADKAKAKAQADKAKAKAKTKAGKAKAKTKPKVVIKPKIDTEDQGSIVLLDIGADNTDLIITDGVRIWQRNVPIGGNHFTRALTKELKLTFAKAEHLKRNATKAPDPRAVFTAMRGVFNDF
ncbi:MAG: pilus assembly protein PilM, partial [Isosphaeraceae bacterium]